MNQYYSAELSQKVHRGLKESYLKGQYTGGPKIFGYDVVDKKNVINPYEAEIVREIFTKFAKGHTGKSIADSLIARGIRTKTGHYLDDKKIYKIIANTKYVGKIKHGDTVYTNIYPAIIDEETWNAVQMIRNSNKHKPGSKKQKFKFLLSGKLICGDCKSYMVGESGKSKRGEVYKYYTCLSRRRRKIKCEMKSVPKIWLEDLVMEMTWSVIQENLKLDNLVEAIYQKHQMDNKETTLIKSLERKRDESLKASNNLIAAIEQGIITEQTKLRLKELETQISQLDFDIEQAKQRSYTYLTQQKIKDYLQKVICGDITAESTREHIVKYLIREVILYNDKVVVTYNFTDKNITKKTTPDDIAEVENAVEQAKNSNTTADLCLYKQSSLPPKEPYSNPRIRFFFV